MYLMLFVELEDMMCYFDEVFSGDYGIWWHQANATNYSEKSPRIITNNA